MMTKSQIKAELRRSACEDTDPFQESKYYAFDTAVKWSFPDGFLFKMKDKELRTFFLLVAEAL